MIKATRVREIRRKIHDHLANVKRCMLVLDRFIHKSAIRPSWFRRRAYFVQVCATQTLNLDQLPLSMRIRYLQALRGFTRGLVTAVRLSLQRDGTLTYTPPPIFLYKADGCRVSIRPTTEWKNVAQYVVKQERIGPMTNQRLIRGAIPRKPWHERLTRSEVQSPSVQALENLVPMVGPTSHNFGHFLLEHVTKLYVIEQALGGLSDVNVLLAGGHSWQREILRWIGLDETQIHDKLNEVAGSPAFVTDPNPVYMREFEIKAEKLRWLHRRLTRSSEEKEPGTLAKTAVNAAGLEPAGAPILLDRAATGKRTLENEEEVTRVVERFGGLAIDPASLNPERARDIMLNRPLVVSAVGAGVLNVLFAPEPPSVLLLVNDDFPPHVYVSVLRALGFETHIHVTSRARLRRLRPETSLSVDVATFEKQLKMIMTNRMDYR